jgi:hypothetical protein
MKQIAMIGLTLSCLVSLPPSLSAQGLAPRTRLVDVGSKPMRIQVAGLEQRRPGQPVIVL